jgi:heavy metal sensor kinase
MKPLSIRWQLTLWYGGVLAAVLLLFSVLVYMMMEHLPFLDEPLRAELNELKQVVGSAQSEEQVSEACDRYFRRRDGYRFEVRTASGKVLFRSERLHDNDLPLPSALPTDEAVSIATHYVGDVGHFRVASVQVSGLREPLVVQAALSLAPYDHELWRLKVILLVTGPVALAFTLGGGYLLARKALAPVEEMGRTVSLITAQDLNRRIVGLNPSDELGRLGEILNKMIARLERSFEEVRRFTADAAHELRTPLAIMRSEAEIALRSPRSEDEYRRVIESMLEETTQLARLSEQLLFLCREDAGLRSGTAEIIPLAELLSDVTDQMRTPAAERNVTITTNITRGCYINGDLQRIRRAFLNLLDNAIKYTPMQGEVRVACSPDGGFAEATIADTGCGIPAEYLPFIFDRFYRVDSSRNPEVKGTGLGLSICRSIVEAHHGSIEVRSTVGVGTQFKIRFPMVQIAESDQPMPEAVDSEPLPAGELALSAVEGR